ncbi:hypothetical protein BDK51DRAFT_41440 [Blyttiomyces helicus]|uniref:arginine--tRNA ligase n=1 Tax=Blyttiomyces helicus TaxID=388810 RepID=A0A4V1IS92_9FUNG|nr:hypothetical protein BDK51DRAFT_41440 [Blyttiomyces helicus]|eukprot:RKO92747.1 hypothetical protein BDK51DRAFT_41440 [Blyttiomyces helicus]
MNSFAVHIVSRLAPLLAREPAEIEQFLIFKGDHFCVPLKKLALSAKEMADLAAQFRTDPFVASTRVAEPLLIFNLDPLQLLQKVVFDSDVSPSASTGSSAPPVVFVEVPLPRLGEAFGDDHLRGAVLGAFVAGACRALGIQAKVGGWEMRRETLRPFVVCISHAPVSAGMILIAYERFGSAEALSASPLEHMHDISGQIAAQLTPELQTKSEERLKRLSDRDPATLAAWTHLYNAWRSAIGQILSHLYLTNSLKTDELEYGSAAAVSGVLAALEERGMLQPGRDGKESVVDLTEYKLGRVRLTHASGAPTPIAAELVAGLRRPGRTYRGSMFSHRHHRSQFASLLRALRPDAAVPVPADHPRSLHHGPWVDVPVGNLSDFSDPLALTPIEAFDRARTHMESMCKDADDVDGRDDGPLPPPAVLSAQVAMSAIAVQLLLRRRTRDVSFDWTAIVNTQGDVGVYLQYAHARFRRLSTRTLSRCSSNPPLSPHPSIERNTPIRLPASANLTELTRSPDALRVATAMARCSAAVGTAIAELEPSRAVAALIELARAVTTATYALRVKDQPRPVAEARLALFGAASRELAKGLRVLGLQPLLRM